ncbi:MAG: prepilin-type N-terminal cleavage/methylation domain-containing protein [Patescibacteria group bacterium]|jgi:prepilin-type N-terminal cleavage/methylation domain-containing protein|nr:prepilin-type N-terminal cleavage/methylation domain-containing protein [Patescibacteria group bacterium]
MEIKQKPRPNGFTITEMLIAIFIFLLVTTFTTSFVVQNFKVNRFALEQSEAINNARKGMDIIVKELREASPSENGSYAVASAQNQSLTFYSDIDADESVEKVRYFLEGSELKRGITEASGFPPVYDGIEDINIISEYVRNGSTPIFYYYNANYPTDTQNNPLPTPAEVNQIRLVRIFLEINVDPGQAPEHFILISNTQLRNLKNNL